MKTKNLFPFLALLVASQLEAQKGAVTGSLRDQSDAIASGVTISAVNAGTGNAFRVGHRQRGSIPDWPLCLREVIPAERNGRERVEFKFEIGDETIDVGTQVLTSGPQAPPTPEPVHEEVMVTARRVEEEAQSVPIPLTVVNGQTVERSGAVNVNRLKDLIPTVQFYSSNPRNSAVNIRGLGSPFGLTNDGIEPGVGFYVDGVFFARPAAGTLDFIDLERIEVLRGPQGTLFGKNH